MTKATDSGTLLSRFEQEATSMGRTKADQNALSLIACEGSTAELRIALYTSNHEWNIPEDWPLWRNLFDKLSGVDLYMHNNLSMIRVFLKEIKTELPEAYNAVINNDVDKLKKVLKTADKKSLDEEIRIMPPLLSYAIATHHHECLKIMLNAGLSPDAETAGTFNGIIENMLMIAYRAKNMKAFKMLVEKGANVSGEADHGKTIIDDLFEENDRKTLRYVMSLPSFKEETVHPLKVALIKADYAKIKELMSASALKPEISAWDWRAYFDWAVGQKDARALRLIYHSSLSDTSKCEQETLDEIKELSEDPAFQASNKQKTSADMLRKADVKTKSKL